jgi:hypothetical protein
VVDGLRLVARKNVFEQIPIADASKDGLARYMAEGGLELLLDLKEVVFGRVEQNDSAWISSRNQLY